MMFIAWGPNLSFLYNDACLPVYGKKHPWALGKPFREVWADVWDDLAPLVEAALAGESRWREDMPIMLERGDYPERAWFSFSYSPLRDDDGNIAGMFCAATETTARVLGEQRLIAERERQKMLFEQVPGFVAILREPEHRFEYVNEAFTRVAGNRDFVGKTVREAFPELAGTGMFEALDKTFATGTAYVAHAIPMALRRAPLAEPVRLRLTFTCQPIPDETGQTSGIFVQGQDVTGEHDTLAQLTHLNATLEEKVAERTRELTMTAAALRQAQKMEAIGRLTGGVAHDFNNLLTPIMGTLDALHMRGIGSELEQRLVEAALRSAERAKTLVQRLLAFARQQPLQAVAVDLVELLTSMGELISSTVGRNIAVSVELDPDLPSVNADANQLELAILNLGVNARDAMPAGGTLTIRAVRQHVDAAHPAEIAPGDYVCLTVADTGVGMDEATRARAADPFFTTKAIGNGTGLGLSMVEGLCAQLGGGLHILSAPGRGTTIQMWLPVSLVPTPASALAGSPGGRRLRVMLVDDETDVRFLIGQILDHLGYEVVDANSGEHALQLLHDGAMPDVLISDYLLPGMSGVDLVYAVRARRPGFPVLVITGYTGAEGIAADLPQLTKPFRSKDLADRLSALLRDAGIHQTA
ncbi:MAG: ATP-binding protein [Sphingomonadales bacterium]